MREVKPAPPQLMVEKKVRRTVQVARNQPEAAPAQVQLASSDRPVARASTVAVVTPAAISAAVTRAQAAAPEVQVAPGATLSTSARPMRKPQTASRVAATSADSRPEEGDSAETAAALPSSARPAPAPRNDKSASLDAPAQAGSPSLFVQPEPRQESMALLSSAAPEQRSETIILTSLEPEQGDRPEATEIVTRDGSGGRNWGVSLGLFRSQNEAEQLLLRTALQESASLGSALSRVANTRRGFEANFVGMSKDTAELACNRLVARQQACKVVGP